MAALLDLLDRLGVDATGTLHPTGRFQLTMTGDHTVITDVVGRFVDALVDFDLTDLDIRGTDR